MPPNATKRGGNRAQVARLHPLSTDFRISGRVNRPRAGPPFSRASDPTDSHQWSIKRNSPTAPGTTHGRHSRCRARAWRAYTSSRLRRNDHGIDRAPAPDRGAMRCPGPGARGGLGLRWSIGEMVKALRSGDPAGQLHGMPPKPLFDLALGARDRRCRRSYRTISSSATRSTMTRGALRNHRGDADATPTAPQRPSRLAVCRHRGDPSPGRRSSTAESLCRTRSPRSWPPSRAGWSACSRPLVVKLGPRRPAGNNGHRRSDSRRTSRVVKHRPPEAPATGRDRSPPVHGGYTRSRQIAECNGHERPREVARSHRSSR
jgi:hypothetical protein